MNDDFYEEGEISAETAADIAETVSEEAECRAAETGGAKKLRAALAQCRQELAEAKNAYLRAHADFDNFRKRMRAERDQEFARGSDRVLADLLPIVDDFERALAVSDGNADSFRTGVELLYRQLLSLLERYGVTPMESEGKAFDPKYHDAVSRVTTTAAPEHTVIGEVQRGYLKNGEVFRPAKVAVAVLPDEGA